MNAKRRYRRRRRAQIREQKYLRLFHAGELVPVYELRRVLPCNPPTNELVHFTRVTFFSNNEL